MVSAVKLLSYAVIEDHDLRKACGDYDCSKSCRDHTDPAGRATAREDTVHNTSVANPEDAVRFVRRDWLAEWPFRPAKRVLHESGVFPGGLAFGGRFYEVI